MEVEVSFIVLKTNAKTIYKVSRRVPNLKISDTKIFTKKKDATLCFNEWQEQANLFLQKSD